MTGLPDTDGRDGRDGVGVRVGMAVGAGGRRYGVSKSMLVSQSRRPVLIWYWPVWMLAMS